jgi:hypothetical protein
VDGTEEGEDLARSRKVISGMDVKDKADIKVSTSWNGHLQRHPSQPGWARACAATAQHSGRRRSGHHRGRRRG